jgi:pimeloyl-ACP methyl ester carboxylesterase
VPAAIAGHVAWGVAEALAPPRLAPDARHAPAGALSMVLRPSGGPTLRGWYVPSRTGLAVLLVHGYGANREALLPEARALAARGHGVLLFDLRAHGESGGRRTAWGDDEQADVSAAVDWLAARPEVRADGIGAVGFSLGAMALAEVAARDPRLRAVVLAGAYTTLDAMTRHDQRRWHVLGGTATVWTLRTAGIVLDHVRPASAVSRIAPRAVLVVAGDADTDVPLDVTRALYAAARPPKALHVVAGAGHGRYAAGAAGEGYLRAVVAFLEGTLADARTPHAADGATLATITPASR